MNVKISKVKSHVAVHLETSGSALAGTIKAGATKVVTSYEIKSHNGPAKVASVLRNARR